MEVAACKAATVRPPALASRRPQHSCSESGKRRGPRITQLRPCPTGPALGPRRLHPRIQRSATLRRCHGPASSFPPRRKWPVPRWPAGSGQCSGRVDPPLLPYSSPTVLLLPACQPVSTSARFFLEVSGVWFWVGSVCRRPGPPSSAAPVACFRLERIQEPSLVTVAAGMLENTESSGQSQDSSRPALATTAFG